jgi:hypothetical protein
VGVPAGARVVPRVSRQRGIERFEEQAISATAKEGGWFLKVTIKPSEFEKHENLIN